MPYIVIAERDGADSSDVARFDSMVDTVLDTVLGSEPGDPDPIGWTIGYTPQEDA